MLTFISWIALPRWGGGCQARAAPCASSYTETVLRELERARHFVLPAAHPKGAKGARSARRLGVPVPDPQEVPGQAGEVRGLCMIKFDTPRCRRGGFGTS